MFSCFLFVILFSSLSPKHSFADDFIIWDSYEIVGPSIGPSTSLSQWQSLAISDDGSCISGVPLNRQIYVSTNYGQTFTAKESNRHWWGIAMSGNGQYQTVVVSYETFAGGLTYRSENYGVTWTAVNARNWWINVGMSKEVNIKLRQLFK